MKYSLLLNIFNIVQLASARDILIQRDLGRSFDSLDTGDTLVLLLPRSGQGPSGKAQTPRQKKESRPRRNVGADGQGTSGHNILSSQPLSVSSAATESSAKSAALHFAAQARRREQRRAAQAAVQATIQAPARDSLDDLRSVSTAASDVRSPRSPGSPEATAKLGSLPTVATTGSGRPIPRSQTRTSSPPRSRPLGTGASDARSPRGSGGPDGPAKPGSLLTEATIGSSRPSPTSQRLASSPPRLRPSSRPLGSPRNSNSNPFPEIVPDPLQPSPSELAALLATHGSEASAASFDPHPHIQVVQAPMAKTHVTGWGPAKLMQVDPKGAWKSNVAPGIEHSGKHENPTMSLTGGKSLSSKSILTASATGRKVQSFIDTRAGGRATLHMGIDGVAIMGSIGPGLQVAEKEERAKRPDTTMMVAHIEGKGLIKVQADT